jgi:hypothetical protein
MLNLAEELVLLCQIDKKGELLGESGGLSDSTIVGGILAELTLAGRLRIVDDGLAVLNTQATGDPLLDEALSILGPGRSWKPDDAYWTGPIIGQMPFTGRVVDGLLQKGVLRKEEKRTLGIFRGIKYSLQNSAVKQDLVNRENRIMVGGQEPDARSATVIFLTSILGEGAPVKRSRKENKAWQKRWEALFDDYWGAFPVGEATLPIAGLNPEARYGIGLMVVSLGTVRSGVVMDYARDSSYPD